MKHSAPDFTEIDRNEIAPLCQNLARRNAPWHIHALHPNCRFNPKPEGYCFVIEDTDAKRVWQCFSNKSYRGCIGKRGKQRRGTWISWILSI